MTIDELSYSLNQLLSKRRAGRAADLLLGYAELGNALQSRKLRAILDCTSPHLSQTTKVTFFSCLADRAPTEFRAYFESLSTYTTLMSRAEDATGKALNVVKEIGTIVSVMNGVCANFLAYDTGELHDLVDAGSYLAMQMFKRTGKKSVSVRHLTEAKVDATYSTLTKIENVADCYAWKSLILAGLASCEEVSKNVFKMSYNTEYSKAIHLGYIRYELANSVHMQKVLSEFGAKMSDWAAGAKELYLAHRDLFLRYDQFGRAVLAFPHDAALSANLANLIASPDEHEFVTATFLADDLGLTLEQLYSTEIRAAQLTVVEMMKCLRALRFVSQLRKQIILDSALTEEVRNKSLLLVLDDVSFGKIAEAFALDPQTMKRTADLLSTNLEEDFVDFFYSPIVEINGSYLFMDQILINSNLIRNLFQRERIRVDMIDSIGTIERQLKPLIARHTDLIAIDVKYKIADSEGDVDLVFSIDGDTYFFECKNYLHPTNPHELRGLFDHVLKAEKQLEKISGMIAMPKSKKALEQKIGFEITGNVTYGIVIRSRVLSGISVGGHRVMDVFQLAGFFDHGTVTLRELQGDGVHVMKSWVGNELTSKDLNAYIQHQDTIYQQVIESRVLSYSSFGFVGPKTKLVQERLALDMSYRPDAKTIQSGRSTTGR